MLYNGFYINLDRNPERRVGMEEELARYGLRGYTRFAASLGNALNFPNPHLKAGEIGCFTSHYRLLMQNLHSEKPLHVIEDDIMLSKHVEPILDQVITSGELDKYDLVYTDVAVPLKNNLAYAYKNFFDANVKRDASGAIIDATFSIVDMQKLPFASTVSFLINPRSIGKLAALYEAELKKGADYPIDLFIRNKCYQGAIRVVCLFPFITSVQPESCFSPTIERRFDELPALAANILRHSFFIGCDWRYCHDYVARVFPQPAASDLHRQLMQILMGYTLMEGVSGEN